ncbi:hypothetical protein Tco_0712099 [Tanacetum coccineum]
MAPVESPQMISTVKLPMLKKGEYTIWSMRMEQYLTNIDYGLWQVSDDEDIFQSEDSQIIVKPSFKKIEFTKARNEPVKSNKQAVKTRMVTQSPKSTGSEEFHQIVDFLADSHIRYVLTANPTIYASLIEQFWQDCYCQKQSIMEKQH